MKVYIGTYTQDLLTGKKTGSDGIYLCDFDDDSGCLKILESYSASANPSYLSLSWDGSLLLAVNELLGEGALDTYRVSQEGHLSHLDRVHFSGSACCHAELAPNGSFVVAVHYGEGEVFAYQLDEGRFKQRTASFFNEGFGPVPSRQAGPHTHSAKRIPGKERFVVCDLGCDLISFYRYDSSGHLFRDDSLSLNTPPGRGPRHSAFTADGNRLYISCELSNSVLYYRWESGKYVLMQEISSLPVDSSGHSAAADIHLSCCGDHLYVSNRGHDSIAHFVLDALGFMGHPGYQLCGGNTPRHFAITRRHLLCANQDSGDITVLPLDENGELGRKSTSVSVPAAACIITTQKHT